MAELPLTCAFAFSLGLLHSLEPSHAKAVLASYFLNRQRTMAEAVAFAVVVTVAHTLTIYALAVIGYAAGPLFNREIAESWSRWIGGVVMLSIGAWMFRSEWRAGFHKHEFNDHAHDHAQGHFFHHHDYGHRHPVPSSMRQIFVLGLCSGAIPCMSGLVVLIRAWTSASAWRGILLVSVFSIGLGVVVLAMCLAMQQMAQIMDAYWQSAARWTRLLPVLSAGLIFFMGLFVLVSG